MSVGQKRVTEWALQTEIAAVAADIADTGPKRDFFGQPQHDVRAAHLALCRSALVEVGKIKAAPSRDTGVSE